MASRPLVPNEHVGADGLWDTFCLAMELMAGAAGPGDSVGDQNVPRMPGVMRAPGADGSVDKCCLRDTVECGPRGP